MRCAFEVPARTVGTVSRRGATLHRRPAACTLTFVLSFALSRTFLYSWERYAGRNAIFNFFGA